MAIIKTETPVINTSFYCNKDNKKNTIIHKFKFTQIKISRTIALILVKNLFILKLI